MAVYFFREKDNGLIKIGYSQNVERRMVDVANQTGYTLELLGVIPGGTRQTELSLHKMFTHLRISGEWFTPGDSLLDFVQHGVIPARKYYNWRIEINRRKLKGEGYIYHWVYKLIMPDGTKKTKYGGSLSSIQVTPRWNRYLSNSQQSKREREF